jgi:hypothetical protein
MISLLVKCLDYHQWPTLGCDMVGFLSMLYVWRIWENVEWVCEKCKVSVPGA